MLRRGGVVSWTTTSNLPVPGLPLLSCATHETCVVPSAKVDPEAGVQVIEGGAIGPSIASVAVTVNVAGAPVGPVASATIGAAGTMTTGPALSLTVTLKLALPGLP